MNPKTKNWIVYGFQILFFFMLTIITVFIEFIWLFEAIIPLNLFDSNRNIRTPVPSVDEVIFSISFAIFIVFNLGIATFSLYSFIFILHVLDTNPAKTAPICAFAIDCSLVNLFLNHFTIYKERYFAYIAPFFPFSIYFHIPSLISQISEILMILAFFTIFLNLQFGIEGIYKSRKLKTNKITDLIHIILITNGLLAIISIYLYTIILKINFIRIIISLIIALFLIGLFTFILRKNKIKYPIEAISIWRHGRVKLKKEYKEEKNTKP